VAAPQRSIEIRVGIFVLVSLLVAGGLIIRYGKYTRLAERTYEIVVSFPNVGGIVKDASVMYAGIPIGKVDRIGLSEGGQLSVKLTLAIFEEYKIRSDARFVINQSGLLGDRYVDIIPQSTTAAFITPGQEVEGATSVDLSEAIRSAVDVLHQAAGALTRVDEAIKRVDEMVLSTQNLLHVSQTMANIDEATSNAVGVTLALRVVVEESRADLTNAFGKLSLASDNMSDASKRVEQVVTDNQEDIRAAIKDLSESAKRVDAMLANLQKGQGTVGKLLVDPSLHDELLHLVQNWRRYGLLYKEGKPKADEKSTSKPPNTNFKP
jgi:phospholipid/cholesterol/gamma-HCH transport system substrate-binding protein